MDTILKDKKAICVFVLPALFIFILIIVVPIFYSLYYSLLEWNGMSKGIFIGFRNYITLFTNQTDGFIKAIINSFKLAGLSVGVQLPIALLLAIILASNVKGENFYRTVYFIPVIISTVIIGQLWMKIYHPTYGLLNVVLDAIGLGGLKNQWLGKKETALGAVFVPMIWQYIGYHMLLFYSAIKSIPKEFFEAAKVDGASGWKTARYITIPLIMPMIKVCVTFAIIGSLKSFDLIYVLTGGGPVHSTEVPSTLMYSTIFKKYMYGYGSAMAIFIIIECLFFAGFVQRIFKTEQVTY